MQPHQHRNELSSATPPQASLREVLVYFLKLGLFGFGGPLALVSSMQTDLIERRSWMDAESFKRALALIKAMPGPVAFQTAVFLGRHRFGWRGGLAAAMGITGPAFFIMVLFAIFYRDLRSFTATQELLSGMQAAALGVILGSLRALASNHSNKPVFWILGALAIILTLVAPSLEPALIIVSGALTASLFQWRHSTGTRTMPKWLKNMKLALLPLGQVGATVLKSPDPTLGALLWTCFKSGALVFGSGLAIVPLMENDFVTRLQWLTHQEFMDALAFGQITPGPVVITATFIGFKKLGLLGAVSATGAIFGAPFFHMMTWFPRFNERLSQLPWISAFLTGAIAAVVGSIVATTIRLGYALDHKSATLPILAMSLGLCLFSKVPVWVVIPTSGLIGWLMILATQ